MEILLSAEDRKRIEDSIVTNIAPVAQVDRATDS